MFPKVTVTRFYPILKHTQALPYIFYVVTILPFYRTKKEMLKCTACLSKEQLILLLFCIRNEDAKLLFPMSLNDSKRPEQLTGGRQI